MTVRGWRNSATLKASTPPSLSSSPRVFSLSRCFSTATPKEKQRVGDEGGNSNFPMHHYPNVSSHPFRSMLYVPASNSRALDKLSKLSSSSSPSSTEVMTKPDAVMFDLEDGVGPNSKDAGRENLFRFFQSMDDLIQGRNGNGAPYFTIVRINRVDTPWFEDDALGVTKMTHDFKNAVDGVVLPKIEGWDDVDWVSRHFQQLFGNAPAIDSKASDKSTTISPIPFWAMMETPRAILSASSISSHPSIQGLILGTNDLGKELQLRPATNDGSNKNKASIRQGLLTSLQTTVLAGRAYEKIVIDGVYNNFRDEEGLYHECVQGKEWGMDGKTLIHPSQISIANQVFAPSNEEIKYARRVVDCWDEATKSGADGSSSTFTGVAVLDGVLIEQLHVDNARRLLERSERI